MIIDVFFAIIVLIAIFNGYKRGLIIGIFSFIAIIVGLAAAIKLSVAVAGYIGNATKISDEWLPIISFIVVFIVVVLLVRWGANIIHRSVQLAMLGWINKLGGIILYLAIYIAVFSVFLFYAEQVHLIKQETINKSVTYSYVSPLGPKAINAFGVIIPFFKDMFSELELFFEGISHKI